MGVCLSLCAGLCVHINPYVIAPWQTPHGETEPASFSWTYEEVKEVHKRWWQLRDNATEIFLTNGRTLLLAFDNTKARPTQPSTVYTSYTHTPTHTHTPPTPFSLLTHVRGCELSVVSTPFPSPTLITCGQRQ